MYISIATGLVVGALVFSPLPFKQEVNTLVPISTPIEAPAALVQIAKGAVVISEFPDERDNYQKTIVIPAQQAEEARLAAEKLEAERVASLYVPPVKTAYVAPVASTGGLVGSIGYAFAGGNCVNQVPLNLRGAGNPIQWSVLTQTPYIGAAALFPYNHVGRITGIWSNGDIEIANENWNGPPQTRFPRSEFRGFR